MTCNSQTVNYFQSINLSVNFKKSKVMIFNPRGVICNDNSAHKFSAGRVQIEVVKEYTYLGFKLTPSGSAANGSSELFQKSRRTWFSVSNLIYRHKKLSTEKAFQIFDQLVTSIGLFNCEYWLPLTIPKKSFLTTDII